MASPANASSPARAAEGPDPRFRAVDLTMKRCRYRSDALIEVLHTAQEAYGYLPRDVVETVAARLRVPLSRAFGVATFYHLFTLEPLGAHTCTVCLGTACYVKRAGETVGAISAALEVTPGATRSDGLLSLQVARCLGSCGMAPVVVLDGEIVGREEPAAIVARLRALIADSSGAVA